MKRSFLPTLLLILALCTCGRAQNLIGDLITFEGIAFADWRDEGNVNFTIDGRASGTPFWGSREAIKSGSRQNALLLQEARGEDPTRFASPFLSFPAGQEVWLGFHQYYRQNEGGSATIEIREDGQLRRTIDLNANLKPGVETGPYDTVMVNLTNELAGMINMTVEFVFTGSSYFWLLDDIGFYDGPPQTIPEAFGNYLRQENYDFAVDSANWAYVPNQLVIQFTSGTRESYMDSLREEFGARLIDSCACDFVELWEIDGTLFQAQGGEQEPATGTTGILSNIIKAKSKTMVDGVDLNTYNLTQPVPVIAGPNPPITDFTPLNLDDEAWSALRIAIMDTGIDYTHPSISAPHHVRFNRTNLAGTESDDWNCLEEDAIGWNFVDNNNNPDDDNGHGTHVAGIIADSLKKYAPSGCDYEFLAYKTHDRNGVSTLFDVACATFQATLDDVDIINDSWGFFGDSSIILSNAIDTAATRDILIISAAGNDMIDLDTLLQFPACYVANNVLTVAASETFINMDGILDIQRAPFSNFSPNYVDIIAPGVDITSAAPGGGTDIKSGTSMATPMVTAEAAIVYACLREELSADLFSYQAVKDTVLAAATNSSRLMDVAQNGRQLVYTESCVCDPVATMDQPASAPGFEVYPNPGQSLLFINSLLPRTAAQLRLLDASGRVIFEAKTLAFTPDVPQSITLPDLPAGLYLLQIGGQDYVWTQKLIRY